MRRIAVRLEEWRTAERRRGALPVGSPAWDAAEVEVRRAQAAYRMAAREAAEHYADQPVDDYAVRQLAARYSSLGLWARGIQRAAQING